MALLAAIVGFLVLCGCRRPCAGEALRCRSPGRLVAGQLAISALDLCLAVPRSSCCCPRISDFLLRISARLLRGDRRQRLESRSGRPRRLRSGDRLHAGRQDRHERPRGSAGRLPPRLLRPAAPDCRALLGWNEIRQQIPATRAALQRVLNLTGAIVPTAASLFVIVAGIVLLASGATPMEPTRAGVIASIFPLPVVEASHLIGSLVASALVVLAPALQRRLNAAYWLALGCLLPGIVVSLAKGLDYEEAILLAVIALLLLPYRRVLSANIAARPTLHPGVGRRHRLHFGRHVLVDAVRLQARRIRP